MMLLGFLNICLDTSLALGNKTFILMGWLLWFFFWRFLMKTQTRNKNKQNKTENVIEALLVIQTIPKSCVLWLSRPDGTKNNNYVFLSFYDGRSMVCRWVFCTLLYFFLSSHKDGRPHGLFFFHFQFIRIFSREHKFCTNYVYSRGRGVFAFQIQHVCIHGSKYICFPERAKIFFFLQFSSNTT